MDWFVRQDQRFYSLDFDLNLVTTLPGLSRNGHQFICWKVHK